MKVDGVGVGDVVHRSEFVSNILDLSSLVSLSFKSFLKYIHVLEPNLYHLRFRVPP